MQGKIMTKFEEAIVRSHIRAIYSEWHGCALSSNGRSKNKLMKEDIARGLKEGQLCDVCEDMINAHMSDIEAGVI